MNFFMSLVFLILKWTLQDYHHPERHFMIAIIMQGAGRRPEQGYQRRWTLKCSPGKGFAESHPYNMILVINRGNRNHKYLGCLLLA